MPSDDADRQQSGGGGEFASPPGFVLLSVVMPCFHLGEKTAAANVLSAARTLRALGVGPLEIIPVDDGSGDGTADGLTAAAAQANASAPDTAAGGASVRIRPVILPENRGKGEAFRAGFEASRGSHVMLLDGDLDLDPSFTPEFLRTMRETGADVVIGSKMHPRSRIDYPTSRRIASFTYYAIVRALFRLPVHDTQTGMKLFRREALRYAFDRSLSKRYAFDLELLVLCRLGGFSVAEAPVGLDYNENNRGALTPSAVADVMNDTAAIFYRLRILRYYQTLEPHRMPERPPAVCAIIPCPGASPMLRRCVAALERQRRDFPELNAIILPDSPTGETWPAFVREIPTGKVLPSDKRNIGIREAAGAEIVAFVDDDARPLDGWLRHALPYFSDPGIVAVGGPAMTAPEDTFAEQMSGRVFANVIVSGAYRRRYIPVRVCSERDLPSCNLLVRASALRDVGGFDTTHWPGEDTVLCLELSRLGRIVYDPRVSVAHHRRPLFGPHLRQVSRYARHRGYFARKFPETSLRPAYFAPSLLLLGTLGEVFCAAAWAFFRTGAFGCASGDGLRACALYELVFRGPAAFGAAVLALYFGIALCATFSARLRAWAWTLAGTVATHYAYGWNFMRGLLALSMPDGVRPFDHRG